jgi:hypothetical protein
MMASHVGDRRPFYKSWSAFRALLHQHAITEYTFTRLIIFVLPRALFRLPRNTWCAFGLPARVHKPRALGRKLRAPCIERTHRHLTSRASWLVTLGFPCAADLTQRACVGLFDSMLTHLKSSCQTRGSSGLLMLLCLVQVFACVVRVTTKNYQRALGLSFVPDSMPSISRNRFGPASVIVEEV